MIYPITGSRSSILIINKNCKALTDLEMRTSVWDSAP